MTIEIQENREPKVIEVTEIMDMLPHRYPFLLVDRVTDYEEGEWLRAVKNVSVNEPCFTARFKRPVVPGDQLVLEVEFLTEKRGITKFTGRAYVDGKLACEADLMCARK